MRSLLLAVLLLAQSSNPAQVQTGTITGRLLALDGTPAAGVRLSAMPAADPTKPSGTAGSDGTVLASLTQTDASGRYRLDNIPPGRYYVLAGFVDSPTYFPGVTAITAATSVSVTANATVAGIDFQAARLSTGLNLKGRLKRDSNEGVGGLNIFLSGNDQYPNVRSLPDGSFEFLRLKPGSYSISVSTPNFPPQQIVLTDKDISNLEFVIPWTVDVSGNVSIEGGGMRPNLTLTFAGGSRGISSTNARDTFRITLPEGAYAVAANGLPSGFFIKSIKSGSTDLLSEPLKLSRTLPPPAIAVTLGVSTPPPWVKLTGRVTGLPMPRADTRLSLNGPVTETPEAIVGADGSFEFPKLLPGTYLIRINPAPLSLPQPSIIVPNSDLAGVLISFPAVKEITGRVSVENGGPLPVTSLNLTGTFGLSVDSGQATLAQLLVASAQPRNSMTVNLNLQNDGTFKAILPEGQYRISATSQFRNANGSVYAVKAFTYGSTDLIRDSVSVTIADPASMNLSFGPTSTIAWSKVTGRVTGPDSSFIAANPMAVTLNANGLVSNWTSPVRADGSFEFPRVFPGTYTARIALPGASQNSANIANLNFGLATATINLTGTDISGLDIAVPREKKIAGKLILEGRGLMPRFAIPITPLPGTSIPQVQYMGINPQPDGSFTVSIMEGARQVGVANGLPAGYMLKSMMYGTTDVLKNPLKVGMSDTAELRVTLTTPNLAPVRVSGKLTGVDDSTFARVLVAAVMSGTNIPQRAVPIHADGSFEFPDVFPGVYSVRATGPGNLNSPSVAVVVAITDVTNVEIPVPRQKDITGRVILEGSGPMPRMIIPLVSTSAGSGIGTALVQGQTPDRPVVSAPGLAPGPLPGPTPGTSGISINPQTDGTFRVTLLEGEQRVSPAIGLPPGYALKSLTYGSTDLLKNPLKIAATETMELQISLVNSATPVKVSGRIEGLDLNTLAKTPVQVTMTSPSFMVPLTVNVRPDGTFEVFKVYPGNYRVLAETDTAPQDQRIPIPLVVGDKEITDLVVTVPK